MKTRHKRKYLLLTWSLLLCIAFEHDLSAQGIGSNSTFLPDTIVDETDRILYNLFIVTPSSGCSLMSSRIESRADSMFIKTCTHMGQLGTPCFSNDTIFIAENLTAGTYHIRHIASIINSLLVEDTLCIDPLAMPDLDTAYYTLVVRQRTSTKAPILTPVQVFPNPAHSILQLSAVWPENRPDEIRLYDGQGRLSRKQVWQDQLDIGDLPEGVYWIHIYSRGEIIGNERFIKIY